MSNNKLTFDRVPVKFTIRCPGCGSIFEKTGSEVDHIHEDVAFDSDGYVVLPGESRVEVDCPSCGAKLILEVG